MISFRGPLDAVTKTQSEAKSLPLVVVFVCAANLFLGKVSSCVLRLLMHGGALSMKSLFLVRRLLLHGESRPRKSLVWFLRLPINKQSQK